MKIFAADIGGTFIKFAVMNEFAEIITQNKIPTPLESHEKFLQEIFNQYKNFDCEGIALSMPGIIDSARGISVESVAIPHNNNKFICAELEKICGVKVTVENDAKCAALAEAKIGSLADVESGFVIVIGTGAGGAFVQNKKVYHGKNNLSGEIGFMSAGNNKIIGEFCGVPALLKDSGFSSGEEFFQAVEQKNIGALTRLDNFTRQIANLIFNIQMVVDVEKFAIGGGISSQEIFIDYIRKNLEKIYDNCLMNFPRTEIVPCKFRNNANLIGAVFNYLSK